MEFAFARAEIILKEQDEKAAAKRALLGGEA